ncbi:hypothetical protein [Jiangella mangrovi]|uniref:DUF3558 domain-containing protein n=1 Tax=Jiangella mangrovi TaxID=1524084 RepID=A0A7W9GTU0_9ACTN|nr:hypothetical protein [Jiangella mangrovi]MBB5789631.1 hypothetical protein [Jiangella mangrovi]
MTSLDRRRAVPAKVALAAAVPLVLLLAGCSNGGEPEVPVVPTSGEPTDGDGTEAAGDPTASPSSTTGVPELCSELASAGDIAQILQVPIQGETVRVYNDEFLPDSGRTGRLTCSYGVPEVPEGQTPPPTPPPVPLEIAVSGYTDAETAAGRIESTVDSAQAAAATVTAQPVAGRDGFLLSDPADVSFVVADDVRTYVITLLHGVVPAAAEPVVLVNLAAHLLGGEPAATTTPGASPAPTPGGSATPTP